MIFVASPGVSYCTRALFASYAANQLVSSTTDGVTTRYAYDAAGRLVKEGNKTYTYGYLDKVLSVTDGDTTRTFTYHADGQLASATVGGEHRSPRDTPQTETFLWDGLALIQRGDEQFVNEPHVGGGNPVASSKGTSYFNDALGTTVGSKSNGKYSAAALTAFGENLSVGSPTPTQNSNFFTGKPMVEGLGHAFLMRNYRAGLAKWQTADPMGYPDGWNQLAYCNNGVTSAVDLLGCNELDDAVNGLMDHFKGRGAAGDKKSFDAENALVQEMEQHFRSRGITDFRTKPLGFIELFEKTGAPYDHGAPYWADGHLWQDVWQDCHVTMYTVFLVCAIDKINTLEWWTATITGAVSTVVGAGGYFLGIAAVGSGAGGAAVATAGLGALLASLFIETKVEIPIGLRFDKFYEYNDILKDKRLIE